MGARISAISDAARDRAFIRRAPYALPEWALLVMALHYGVTGAYNLVTGSIGAAWQATPLMALRWGLLSFAASLSLLACLPLLNRLRAMGLDWTRPRLGSWGIYYGIFATAVFAGSYMRSALAPWALGTALSPKTFWQMVALLAFSLLSTLAACEVFLARRRTREAWLVASERLERDLARSRAELVDTDDRLRREAAEHLHGEVQSRLLMAWALMDQARGACDGAQARDLLARVQEQLDRLQGMGLPHARELLGHSQADLPLSEVVAELVERFRAVVPVELATDPAVPACEALLAPELRRAAGRMVEEALLNAFRHARAKRVRVRFERPATLDLVLTVEDDGVGFEPGTASKGLGLSGLGADLAGMGGVLELESRPGRGTRVVLRLPLAARAPEAIA